VYEDLGGGWVRGRIEEIPAILTAGRNREEAERMLKDELRYLKEAGGPFPDGVTRDATI
jgi:predicted RNase H-like HicB family nuclease